MVGTRYVRFMEHIKDGGRAVLDGGVGTELERRGVRMDGSWCGSASLNSEILTKIHLDYINSGSSIITANTYASSRIMLSAAGLDDHFNEINTRALKSAFSARKQSGNKDILIAGSLSHRLPIADGDTKSNPNIKISTDNLYKCCLELASFLTDNGVDFILLEMMYDPKRMETVFKAAKETKAPIWAGFSLRRGANGKIVSFTDQAEIPFLDLIEIAQNYRIDVMGIMHTSVDLISEAVKILRSSYKGPIMVYPDSGGWLSPNWDFSTVISPEWFSQIGLSWFNQGVQIVGGCCGLSPDHIKALVERIKLQDCK